MPLFSIRHRRALEAWAVQVEFTERIRNRIRRQLHNFDVQFENEYQSYSSTLDEVLDELHDAYGMLPGDRSVSVERLVSTQDGAIVLDVLEAFANHGSIQAGFPEALNEVLQQEESGWRMLGGQMVLLDDHFMRDDIARQADDSLEAVGIAGALRELRYARNDIVDEKNRTAVHSAGSAFESVMMALLERRFGTAKSLAQDLRRAGYFDGLDPDLRERFASVVMQALPWMRNKLGAHGQGAEDAPLPRAYAELAVGLSAALVHFLVSLELERNPGRAVTSNAQSAGFFAAPAAASAPADDDIPFSH